MMKKQTKIRKAKLTHAKHEQQLHRRTREELTHRWQNSDWSLQLKEYLKDDSKPF
jgi:hypothetical protein